MRDYPAYRFQSGLTINEEMEEPLMLPVMDFSDEADKPRTNVRTHKLDPKPPMTLNQEDDEPLLPPEWTW